MFAQMKHLAIVSSNVNLEGDFFEYTSWVGCIGHIFNFQNLCADFELLRLHGDGFTGLNQQRFAFLLHFAAQDFFVVAKVAHQYARCGL